MASDCLDISFRWFSFVQIPAHHPPGRVWLRLYVFVIIATCLLCLQKIWSDFVYDFRELWRISGRKCFVAVELKASR